MRIIKRKKGNKEYFYLQHSIRKRGKIVTKEKYLGKDVPKNIKRIIEDFRRELQTELYKKLEKIKKKFQIEWKKYPKSVKERIKEDLSIAFTYNTNAIEGSTITFEEAREIIHDKISPNKPLRDVKEAEAHSKVFLEIISKKEKITNSLVLRWHKQIFGETKQDISGKYRKYFVVIGKYIAPDWRKVNQLMKELVLFINKSKMNPVELAARAHYMFESIHPFGDGNGRIGRLIMNHILWHAGYPMLIIEYKKRRSYYRAFLRGEDAFVSYFLRRYLAVHAKRLK